MKKNKKILEIGLIMIGITMALCTFLIYYSKLDKPVFFEHYYEYGIQMTKDEGQENVSGQVQFSLQYITNTTDKRSVSYVMFKEAPGIMFNTNTNWNVFTMFNNTANNNASYNMGNNYGRYSIRTVDLNAQFSMIDEINEELPLSQAIIYFDNGDVVEVNIGKIFLYINKPIDGNITL